MPRLPCRVLQHGLDRDRNACKLLPALSVPGIRRHAMSERPLSQPLAEFNSPVATEADRQRTATSRAPFLLAVERVPDVRVGRRALDVLQQRNNDREIVT
jgi:hypothetical protein